MAKCCCYFCYKAKKGSILPSIQEEEKKKNCLPSAVAGGGWNEHVSWLQFGILHYIAQCNVLQVFLHASMLCT